MRTLSAAQTSLLQSSNRSVHVRVRVDRSDGNYDTENFSSPTLVGHTTGASALELVTGITVAPWSGTAGLGSIGPGSSDYSTTSSETEITVTSGNGQYATVTYTAGGGGDLATITVVNPGIGYFVGETITIPGGNNHTVSITNTGNALPAGNLYTSASGVATTTTGSGSGLTVNTTASYIGADLSETPFGGMLTRIDIQSTGSGYAVGDKIVVSGKATGATIDYTAVFTVKEIGGVTSVQNATKPSTAIYTGNFNTVDRQIRGLVTTIDGNTSIGGDANAKFTEDLSVGSYVNINNSSGTHRAYITSITDNDTAILSAAASQGQGGRTVKIEPGSNIVDLSNYEGHNWIESVEWGDETDSKGGDAEITLVRQIDNLSLSPLIGKSLLNKHIGKESKPIDVSKKIVIEVCTLPMDQNTPLDSDWNEVFRGYIEEIEWGTETISLRCRDLSAKYQDWLIYRTNVRDSNSNEILYGNGQNLTGLAGHTWVHSLSTSTLSATGSSFTTALSVGDELFLTGYGNALSEDGTFKVTVKSINSDTSFTYNESIGSTSFTVTDVQQITTGASNIFAIIQSLMSSQNDGYAFDSTVPPASYSANNVDHYLYTPNGTSSGLPTTSFKTNLALTGTVTVPSKFAAEPNKIVGVSTKFSSQLYVGAQVAISYTGGTFSTVVDQIDSDTSMYVQDQSPLALSIITATSQTEGGCIVTSASHGMANGTKVTISNVGGMDDLNGLTATVSSTATDTFVMTGVDSSDFDAYTGGGVFAQAGRTVTLDERAAYIPNKAFDALDKTLMDMCVQFAEELGWNFGFKWNDNVTTTYGHNGGAVDATTKGAFVPMLTCPLRDRVTSNVDFTFTPSTYYDITQASLSQSRMRNFIRVHYNEYFIKDGETKTTNNKFIEVSDPSSISKYGRRTVRVGGNEGSLALIDSQVEAQRFGTALLKDLRNIDIVQEVDMPFFWAASVGDYYKFEANNDHYDEDQYLAVHSYRHSISDGDAVTSMVCRSKPSGYLNSYGNIMVTDATAPRAPTLAITTSAAPGLDFAVPGNYEVVTVPSTTSRKVVRAFDDTALNNTLTHVYAGADVTLKYNGDAVTHTSKVNAVVSRSYFLSEETGDGYGINFLQIEDAVAPIAFAGTVSIAAGSRNVTGSGTAFSSTFSVNDRIAIQLGQRVVTRKITAIGPTDANTSLAVDSHFIGYEDFDESVTVSGLPYAEAFEDCSITVGGAGSILSAPVGVTLKSTLGAGLTSLRKYSSTIFYMATSSSDLLNESIENSRINFSNGGTFLGESDSNEIHVTSLTPGTTYYFRCKTKRDFYGEATKVSLLGENQAGIWGDSEEYSPFSNIVEFTPTGNNAVHQDANYSNMVQYNPDPDIASWVNSIRNNSSAGPNIAPPANWKMVTGTWDTEFKRELTTVKSGVASMKCPSGGNAAAAIETALFPVPAGGLVRAVSSMLTEDDGAQFTINLHEYQADKSTHNGGTSLEVGAQTDLRNEEEDTWVEMSKGIKLASTTKWCKFKFLRSNNTGNVYINDARLINGVITFRASKTNATACIDIAKDGVRTTIVFNDRSNAPNHSTFGEYDAGTGIYSIHRNGVYEFASQVNFVAAGVDADHFGAVDSYIQILVNSTAAAYNYGEAITTLVTQFKINTGPLSLRKGDTVKVQVYNGTAQTVTIGEAAGNCFFNGKQID